MESSGSAIRDKTCPKCGSAMAFRHHIVRGESLLILQCTVCRHYLVIEKNN